VGLDDMPPTGSVSNAGGGRNPSKQSCAMSEECAASGCSTVLLV
jgi:hypothetical protein